MTDDDKPAEVVKIDSDEGETIDLVEAPKNEEPTKPREKPKESEKPDDRETALEDLKRQLRQSEISAQQERQAREQAEHFARQQAGYAQSAMSDAENANFRTLVNAIDATEQIAAAAERAYADAMQAGDYQQAAKAQRAMAQAESQLLRLNEGKSSIESRLEQARNRPPPATTPMTPPVPPKRDPIEELAANLTPKSAEWLRAHPRAADEIQKLTAAHSAAVNLEGLEVESPEYFSYIEQKLGMAGEKSAPKPAPKPAMASAPVSGGGSVGAGRSSGNSMHLSAAEVEIALLSNPDLPRDQALKQYAQNKQELIKLGKMSA